MRFAYLVTVDAERIEGKFAGRDEVGEELSSAIEGADPGSIDGIGADGTSSYEVSDWTVEEVDEDELPRLRRDLRTALDLLDLARCSSADPGILRSWVGKRTGLLRRHTPRKAAAS